MDIDRFNKQIEFITEIDKVKEILRNTVLMDASRRENDAEHMWHMAVGILVFSEYANEQNLDLLKVLKMVLVHDIVEIDAGDTFAYGNADCNVVAACEQKAAQRIFGLLPEDQSIEFIEIWKEFEQSETKEARFAKAMDSFMPILHNYSTNGLQWQKHNVSSERVLTRNSRIEKGSEELWEYIKDIMKDAVQKGYIKP
ncbi:MAG: phosphohydrolase [Clostridiaceae bacterium]|jgi:putative hydrolase of HD superfamily|nr:phosphohydrolase [Clostridiaceae bacterium]